MKYTTLFLFSLVVGLASAQVLPPSAFESKNIGLHGMKNVWLQVVVTDNMKGRDLDSKDMWDFAAASLRKEGFIVAQQGDSQESMHYPALTITLDRLGSIRCGYGWYATYTAELYLLSVIKLPSGKYVKWNLYDNSTYGYALADQASGKLLDFQNENIKDLGELYRKAN